MANVLKKVVSNRTMKNICYIHSSYVRCNENKAMRKIIRGSVKKKHRYTESPILPSPKVFSQGTYEGKQSSNSIRSTALNKLFMRYITDLMATGESSSEFVGYGIEINRVQITPDYNGINVFWLAKGTESDEVIEKILEQNCRGLRHELSQLRVMGVVPKIRFVKDKHCAQIMEVDLRLAKADFGEDYEPLESAIRLKTQLELNTKLPPHIKEKLQNMESEKINQDYEENIPVMPQNILGLNHAEIMTRVTKAIQKSQASHRLTNDLEVSEECPKSLNLHPVRYSNLKSQREAFKEFLASRQILRNKMQKSDKYGYPELDYYEEEYNKIRDEKLESLDINHNCDDDYIDEDIDLK